MTANTDLPARVLLVDDDPAQLRLWQHVLRRGLGQHIEIDAQSDSLAAMAHAQEHAVDILITDLSMPGVGGLDLVRCVKERNPCAQALLITGTSTTESLLESIDLGAADYLLKPIQAEELVQIVQQADARLQRWRTALAGALRHTHSRLTPSSH